MFAINLLLQKKKHNMKNCKHFFLNFFLEISKIRKIPPGYIFDIWKILRKCSWVKCYLIFTCINLLYVAVRPTPPPPSPPNPPHPLPILPICSHIIYVTLSCLKVCVCGKGTQLGRLPKNTWPLAIIGMPPSTKNFLHISTCTSAFP